MKYPTPAVSAVILNSDRRVLLTLRSRQVTDPGKWCLPGGHLEGGYDWLATLAKEVKEEIGLSVADAKLVGIYSDPELHSSMENGERKHFLTAAFLVTRYEGEVKLNCEVERVEWFASSALPELLLECEVVKIKDAFQFKGEAFVR